jgi:glycerophosphoryl diester phosphodiesterase
MAERRKLVSHRLRGFGRYENSRSSLERACASSAPYLEIDTRVTADGHIFVYHNPRASAPLSARGYFAETPGRLVRRAHYPSGEAVLEFEHAVEIFSRRGSAAQRLCVDMKDFGFEREHLAIVDQFGVGDRICWISWLPRSLQRLRAFGASGPLILAHCNLIRLATLGRWIESACARRAIQLSHVVLFGAAHERAIPLAFAHGFQHGLLASRLPSSLERLLADSGGGVCVNRLLLSEQLVRYCRAAGLQLWVFRVRTVAAFQRYASLDAVDVVFSDDAPAVLSSSFIARGNS